MADGLVEANGKAEKIGELRGELKALVRSVQELRAEEREHYHQSATGQAALEKQLADLAAQWSNHVVFHTTQETVKATVTGTRRWSVQTTLMTLGLMVSLGLGLAALLSK